MKIDKRIRPSWSRFFEVHATRNLEKWGVQKYEELMMAMIEELGELS